jgi:3-methyladenine DNA glycosylase AlkD
MTVDEALEQLRKFADPTTIEGKAAYHKIDRTYIGTNNQILNDLGKDWRQALDLDQRIELARGLWDTNIFEGRVMAAKLLTQARIRPDQAVWDLITNWIDDFDSWAIADHACMAGQKRVVADPARLDHVETWITSDHIWQRRAAFVITLPYTKQNFPKPHEIQARERVLGWAAQLVTDHDWFIQKAIAWWVRDLSRHDAMRAENFLERYGADLKPFAQKEAARHMNTGS